MEIQRKLIRELDGEFGKISKYNVERASKYIVLTGDNKTDYYAIIELELLRRLVVSNKSNDIAKYALPEAFRTKLQLSVNLRELIHILELRINKDALWEFREISKQIIDVLPDNYKELVLMNEEINKNYKELRNEKFN